MGSQAFVSLGHSWIYKCKFVEGPSGMKTEELVNIKMWLIPRCWDQSLGRAGTEVVCVGR